MKISILKEPLFDLLLKTTGIIERKHTLPILSHILFQATNNKLTITASNTEIEIQAFCHFDNEHALEFTVNARKLLDIVKLIDDGSLIQFELINNMLHVKANRSHFTLGTLQIGDYPIIQFQPGTLTFNIEEKKLKNILHSTSISMAQEDVRYYLKGMLFEINNTLFRTVSTDGHRLSMNELNIDPVALDSIFQSIVPRKTILELNRILQSSENVIGIEVSTGHIRFFHPELTIISKLIDGKYPDYHRVIPTQIAHTLVIDRLQLRAAIQRTAVLSNDKYKAIRFETNDGLLKITGDNPEHESAEEILELTDSPDNFSIGFNFSYLLEILQILDSSSISISISEDNSSTLIQDSEGNGAQYVVMPMRI
jgi:DNA polymerase-3 subunit beta